MESSIAFDCKIQRLSQALCTRNDSELARALGITPPSVASARQKQQLPIGWIEKASLISNTSLDWLYFGRESMRPGDTSTGGAPRAETPPEPAPQAECPRCTKLEAKIEKLEARRDMLEDENRELWKKNSLLHERGKEVEIELAAVREQLKRVSGRDVAAARSA